MALHTDLRPAEGKLFHACYAEDCISARSHGCVPFCSECHGRLSRDVQTRLIRTRSEWRGRKGAPALEALAIYEAVGLEARALLRVGPPD